MSLYIVALEGMGHLSEREKVSFSQLSCFSKFKLLFTFAKFIRYKNIYIILYQIIFFFLPFSLVCTIEILTLVLYKLSIVTKKNKPDLCLLKHRTWIINMELIERSDLHIVMFCSNGRYLRLTGIHTLNLRGIKWPPLKIKCRRIRDKALGRSFSLRSADEFSLYKNNYENYQKN